MNLFNRKKKPEEPKSKLRTVNPIPYDGYGFAGLQICAVREEDNKITRANYNRCKEIALQQLTNQRWLRGALGLVTFRPKMPEEVFFRGIDGFCLAARSIEKMAGWEPLTRYEPVVAYVKNTDDYGLGAYIESPESWKRAPQLTSLYLLLLAVLHEVSVPLNVDTVPKLIRYLGFIMELHRDFDFTLRINDETSEIEMETVLKTELDTYLPVVLPCIYHIIRFEKEIFPERVEDAYPKGVSGSDSGIYNFCSGRAKAFKESYKKLVEKIRIETETTTCTGGKHVQNQIHEGN